jgi:RNA 3'-terminal phosphate cyclase
MHGDTRDSQELVVKQVRRYLQASVPVSAHLADQLLLPLALAAGGAFKTVQLSSHALSNIDVIRSFLPIDIQPGRSGTHVPNNFVAGAE